MTLTSFLIIINNEKIKSSKKKFPVLYASWVSCILFWSHNTSYFLAGIFPCLLPLPYISFLPRASSCLFLHHPPLFFLLHSYHLHFHVNTWIKGRNRNEVKCFLLCGQDATSIKVTLMHCWSRSVSTASCFRVLTLKPLGPGQSTLEWGKGGRPLSWGPATEIMCRSWASQLWRVGSLSGIGQEIWSPTFVTAWWFASMVLFWATGVGKSRITVAVLRCTPHPHGTAPHILLLAVSCYNWLVGSSATITNPK